MANILFYASYPKGVGRIYYQTVVKTYSSVTFAKVYIAKVPLRAADLLNDRALPFFEEQEIPVLRVLTDEGTEFRGAPDKHLYDLHLKSNDISVRKPRPRVFRPTGSVRGFTRRFSMNFTGLLFGRKSIRIWNPCKWI